MKGGVEPHPVSRQARLEQMESEELQDWANLVATRKKNEEKQRAWAALRFRSESRRTQQHNNNNKGKKSKEADSDDEMQLYVSLSFFNLTKCQILCKN